MSWKVVYYDTIDGLCPIGGFIDSCNKRQQAKVLSLLAHLEERGPHLPRPYADFLEDGIHELRIKLSGQQTRILYFFCYKDFIVLTHAFIKTTKRAPQSEIQIAKNYREDFLTRYTDHDLRKA